MDISEVRKMAKAYRRLGYGQKDAFVKGEAERLGVSTSRVRQLIAAGNAVLDIEAAGARVPKNTPIKWLELVADPQATARALNAGVGMADAITAAPEPRGVLLDEGQPELNEVPANIATLAIAIHDIATQTPISELRAHQRVLVESLDVLHTCVEATITNEGETK